MIKRIVDFFSSFLFLILFGWVIFILWIITSIDTQSNGLFIQSRIGQFGRPFQIFKLKTVHPQTNVISPIGSFFRKLKLDELPQLFNVLIGDMSVVGPRPDVPGYYDQLQGEERKILQLKPGLTSLASLKYINEEEFLLQQNRPLEYNDTVIFPDKVKMNLDYFYCNNVFIDIKIIIKTIVR